VENINDTPAMDPSKQQQYMLAIQRGRLVLEQENSKAAAAREIYALLHDQPREVVLRAFEEGADCTPKSCPTYFYNITRKLRRKKSTN
jgi:hypothetical protein